MLNGQTDAKPCVLIVEDSPDFSNLLKFIVEDEGVEGVQFPVTEVDILSWVHAHKPVLIITDLALRRKSGLEYIKDLKENRLTREIPIVIITGRDLSLRPVEAYGQPGVGSERLPARDQLFLRHLALLSRPLLDRRRPRPAGWRWPRSRPWCRPTSR